MIRIRPTTDPMIVDGEGKDQGEKFEEKGYQLGARGNQCETNLNEAFRKIEEKEIAVETEYEEMTKEATHTGSKQYCGNKSILKGKELKPWK